MNPKICITIPITAQLDKNLLSIKKVLNEKPQFVELRFDFIDKVEELTREFINNLKKAFDSNISIIFTLRDYSEGGNISINKDDRISILNYLIDAKPDYFDIELRSDLELLNQVINKAIKNQVRMIFSYHDSEKTPCYIETIHLIETLKERLVDHFSINLDNLKEIIYKFIFTAQTVEDNLIPLKVCKKFKERNQKVISFCMGEMGILSRVICVLTGSFLTYACLEEQTASGQIDIYVLKEVLKLLDFKY